uniref:WAP domain-containing protein n=1 Tax=Clastoptera arizonana TaxID=38151 RepID=A0A1B6CZF1_9HEMI
MKPGIFVVVFSLFFCLISARIQSSCLGSNDDCIDNEDCCSKNCTGILGTDAYSGFRCQPYFEPPTQIPNLDLDGVKALGIKNVTVAEERYRELKMYIVMCSEKMRIVSTSLTNFNTDQLESMLRPVVGQEMQKLDSLSDQNTVYNGRCIDKKKMKLSDLVFEVTGVGLRCAGGLFVKSTGVAVQIGDLTWSVVTGPITLGAKILIQCTMDILLMRNAIVTCVQNTVNMILEHICEKIQKAKEIFNRLQRMAVYLLKCKKKMVSLLEQRRDSLAATVNQCLYNPYT